MHAAISHFYAVIVIGSFKKAFYLK